METGRSNRVLGEDASTITYVIASEAWRFVFWIYLLETCGQFACSARTPARSITSSRGSVASVAICLLVSISWRPAVSSRARRGRRHDHLRHREQSVAICLHFSSVVVGRDEVPAKQGIGSTEASIMHRSWCASNPPSHHRSIAIIKLNQH